MNLYKKICFEPKYIISINGNYKHTIYQKYPNIQNLFGNNIELYIQDTININKENPNKIIFIYEDKETENEYIIDDIFFIENIMKNISNSRNKKYNIYIINDEIITINEEYENTNIKYNKNYINEKIFFAFIGTLALTNLILYKILF